MSKKKKVEKSSAPFSIFVPERALNLAEPSFYTTLEEAHTNWGDGVAHCYSLQRTVAVASAIVTKIITEECN